MPCWVAPIVAAELWCVTPGHVLGAIADGSLPSRTEYGFVLVDVAPEGACPTPRSRQGPPPPTYVVVSYDDPIQQVLADEVPPTGIAAVLNPLTDPGPLWVPPAEVPAAEVPAIEVPAVDDELPPLDEEEDDTPITNWRQVRSNMGRMRKPPARTPPPAAFAALASPGRRPLPCRRTRLPA